MRVLYVFAVALLLGLGCAATAQADSILSGALLADPLLLQSAQNLQILPIRLDDGGAFTNSDATDVQLADFTSSAGPKSNSLFDSGDAGADSSGSADATDSSFHFHSPAADPAPALSFSTINSETYQAASQDNGLNYGSATTDATLDGIPPATTSDQSHPVLSSNDPAVIPTPLPQSVLAALVLLATLSISRSLRRQSATA